MKRTVTIPVLLLLLYAPTLANGQVVWASSAIARNDHQLAVPASSAAVGKPNGTILGVSTSEFLYALDFNFFKGNRTTPVIHEGLAGLLGYENTGKVPDCWDVIAFEGNQNFTAGGGWESGIWLFTDETRVSSAAFNSDEKHAVECSNTTGASPVFKSGTVPRQAYEKVFNFDDPNFKPEWVSWILIDVPDEVNVDADRFRIWITGAAIGLVSNRAPDIDAIGVIRH